MFSFLSPLVCTSFFITIGFFLFSRLKGGFKNYAEYTVYTYITIIFLALEFINYALIDPDVVLIDTIDRCLFFVVFPFSCFSVAWFFNSSYDKVMHSKDFNSLNTLKLDTIKNLANSVSVFSSKVKIIEKSINFNSKEIQQEKENIKMLEKNLQDIVLRLESTLDLVGKISNFDNRKV